MEKSKDIILYTSEDGRAKLQVSIDGETVWLSQKQMAELFQCSSDNIGLHLKNIFKDGELEESSVTEEYSVTASDGKKYRVKHYNLDAIISVGYRVNSVKGTQFRVWATKVLKEYVVKGFALDDQRLKSGKSLRKEYFEELLERIRDIRASERIFYQKITDIYAQCSADYDPGSQITQEFYATVQNKLHWAIHRHTAAELIAKRVSACKPYMGLTTWKNAPKGRIRRTDVTIAKNYLTETELRQLNRIVTMYLDYAETQAEKQQTMTMKDWVSKLDAFLKFNEKDVLTNFGKVSAEVAQELAEKEFEKYEEKVRKIQASQPVSDFDKLVEKTRLLEKKSTGKRNHKGKP
ncbi:hydroxyacid dehydrogenase [Candidatus Desantisbacteria bacterium CG_4_10_14_0_8_um_filter_39_17]|uniref:Hydroxyacid dehydrogenase n=1 Tax=Candidatus Desantisbacteria bacterium CG_4_10_14_0_8_um_filter_39_17 TaxID=1974542 RepID=A0A2H9PAI3_9BACT|nr:MAG: hydroxyacid dehydrogenase [Candidatus Desantisbacteria bacterium CG_4_10_14_0_8_um_filter_39_17]